VAVDTAPAPRGTVPALAVVRRGLRNPLLVNVSTVTFALLVLVAVLAPWITPYGPVQTDSSAINQPPSAAHWFGTDTQGMDVFTRVLYAARIDLGLSISGVTIALVAGLLLGSAAAFFRGWVDEVVSRVAEMFQSIPLFLFALLVIAALGNSPLVLAGIIAVFYTPVFFKVARSVASPLLGTDFVAVARTAGRTPLGIIGLHLAPNALGPLLSQFAINVGFAIQVIAGLSFLGLGIPIPQPEWGNMISIGASRIAYGQWWMAFFPGLAVFITVIALDGISRRVSDGGTR
jgi:peptide/nickel transport system permease protein